jgi:hypothetical protein
MEVSGQLYAPGDLTQWRAPGTHWVGGWVGRRAGLDAVAKWKNSITAPRRHLNPGRPAPNFTSPYLSYRKVKVKIVPVLN